jgi:hypothetical protein
VRLGLLAVTLSLAGCAAGGVVGYLPDPPAPDDLSQPNYRQIIADNLRTVFPEQTSVGTLQISGARPFDHLRGRAWLVCIRINADSRPLDYAVFIIGDKIIDTRTGVVIDRCNQQSYEAFDPATFAHPRKVGR